MTSIYPTPVEFVAPAFTAEFSYAIESIRTTTIGDKDGVIVSASISIKGEEGKTSFSLPKQVEFDAPGDSFIVFGEVTEADVIEWCLSKIDNIEAIKRHIQMIVDRDKVQAASVHSTLPWKPQETYPAAAEQNS